jgi:hypothetical protein
VDWLCVRGGVLFKRMNKFLECRVNKHGGRNVPVCLQLICQAYCSPKTVDRGHPAYYKKTPGRTHRISFPKFSRFSGVWGSIFRFFDFSTVLYWYLTEIRDFICADILWILRWTDRWQSTICTERDFRVHGLIWRNCNRVSKKSECKPALVTNLEINRTLKSW